MLELTDSTLVDVSTSDLAHGGGVFETIAVRQGNPLFLNRHLARLADGLRALRMPAPPDPETVRSFIRDFLLKRMVQDGALRLLAADGRLMVMTRPGYDPPLTTRVALATGFRRCSQSALAGIKSAAYLENRLLTAAAQRQGLFDLIALNEQDCLTDGGRCNVFLVMDGRAVTPRVQDGCLPGVVRELLIEHLPIDTRSIHRDQVRNAEAGWVTSSLAGVIPLTEFGKYPLDPGHPLVRQAQDRYGDLVAEEVVRFRG